MLHLLPHDLLLHVCGFIDEGFDVDTLDLIVHTHDYHGNRFLATKSIVRCWRIRTVRTVLPLNPIADQESGLRYQLSTSDLGLDMCSNRTCHADGSISFYTIYGESITLYTWRFKQDVIPMTDLYDAVVDERWSDLPSGKVVQLYKIPRIPTSESLSPGKLTFDDGYELTLHNRFLIVCDPQCRRDRLLSSSPDTMVSFSDMKHSMEKHHRIDRDREGTLAVMDGDDCIYGGSLHSHYQDAIDDLVSPSISRVLHLSRGLRMKIRGRLCDMAMALPT